MFMPIGGASIETFSTPPPPRNLCRCHNDLEKLDSDWWFQWNVIAIHL